MTATAATVPSSGAMRTAPGTLNQLFFNAAERHDKPNALQWKSGGSYHALSHKTLVERVRRAALGLRAIGVTRGSRVGLLSENRPEWAIADYACLTSGVTNVPLYPTLPAEQMAYILKDSGAVAVFVSTAEQAAKIASVRGELPALTHVISFAAEKLPGVEITLAALEAKGAAMESAATLAQYRANALSVRPDDLATIIYTSGTTGAPKGAMLSHGNITSNVVAVQAVIPFYSTDVSLSFLPLSHILERMFDYLMYYMGVSIAYVESIDTILQNIGRDPADDRRERAAHLREDLRARARERARRRRRQESDLLLGARRGRALERRDAGRAPPRGCSASSTRIADKLVFSKLRARVGGRLRYFVSRRRAARARRSTASSTRRGC